MEEWLHVIEGLPQGVGALALFAAALIEYVFPPFPGDAICLCGAFLVGHGGWSLPLVFAAVMAGNVVGLAADFGAGVWLRRRLERKGAAAGGLSRRLQGILALEPRFRKAAVPTLLFNRFLPGIRALLFVAAGFFGVSGTLALALGFLSALLWNALIFAAGVAVGLNWQELSSLVSSYTTAVWIALGVLAIVLLVRWWRARRRARGGAQPPP
jgi:membrane-associated protein